MPDIQPAEQPGDGSSSENVFSDVEENSPIELPPKEEDEKSPVEPKNQSQFAKALANKKK